MPVAGTHTVSQGRARDLPHKGCQLLEAGKFLKISKWIEEKGGLTGWSLGRVFLLGRSMAALTSGVGVMLNQVC